MKTIPLTQGKVALIDDEDYEAVSSVPWQAIRRPKKYVWYAFRTVRAGGCQKTLYMHQVVLPVPPGSTVDHINLDGLDNRRANLRPASMTDQNANRPTRANNTSGFKGVSRVARCRVERWAALIRKNGRRIHIGLFGSPVAAARAYDAKARELFGEFARTNFQKETVS